MTPPAVAAIVVVFNPNVDYLRQCIDSLIASTAVELDVIVVDNASDIRVELAPRPHVRVERLAHNRGFAAGVNAGLVRTDTPFVWLLNDDAWVEPGCIAAAVAALEQAPQACVGVAPKVLVADETKQIIDSVGNVLMATGEGFNLGIGQPDLGQFDHPERCFGVCFAAGLFRRSAFGEAAVGALDERYFLYYEDIDWCLRANRAGFEFWTAPAAIAYHRHSVSTRQLGLANRYRIVERNLLINATKNLGPRSIVAIWSRRFYVHAVGLFRGPYRIARWQAIGTAAIRVPSIVVRRFWNPAPASAMSDAALFAFAEGERPFFDVDSFTANEHGSARAAALARLRRRNNVVED